MLLGDRKDIRARHFQANTDGGAPMPVIDVHVSTVISQITAEAISVTSGTQTGQLANAPILSSLGDRIGQKGDSSLTFSGTLTTEVMWHDGLRTTNSLASGEYAICYETGVMVYNSGATTNITVDYKVRSGLTSLAPSGNDNIFVDDSAFTPATSNVGATGFFADETATDSVNEGDVGIARMTLDRKQIQANHYLDDAAWTPAAAGNYVGLIGGEADETSTDSVDEGDVGAFRMSLRRAIKNDMDTTLALEDLTNSVGVTVRKPLAVNTYAWSTDISQAYEASSVSKASAGTLRSCDGYNSLASAQFIQIHDASSLPADTAVPEFVITVPASSNFSIDFGEDGLYFAVGIVICNSTTGPTKTIGAANLYMTTRYI